MVKTSVESAQVSLDFSKLKRAVAGQFKLMQDHEVFRADVEGDVLWETYLRSFPPGTDPMFRKRTEHDCSSCRGFIKKVGGVVAVLGGKITTLWDVPLDDPAYQAVAKAMSSLVKSKQIREQFLHDEPVVGVDKNFENKGETLLTWTHFHGTVSPKYYCRKTDIPTRLGKGRATHDVMLRSLVELTQDSVDTVLELISQNSLYRGPEQKFAVESFLALKKEFSKLDSRDMDAFAWSRVGETPASVSMIRNTAIGTLLVDLSEGMDLEGAVRKFEAVMAPANYKRPTSIVTQSMVEAARKKIDELGLASALERRYARLTDISVNDILFADREARKSITGDVFDSIATKGKVQNLSKIEEVPIEKFVNDILPHIDSMEVMLENRHEGNLVSLIAPADDAAKPLFKWNNNFSWSYNGDLADSIKERVKKAGGSVEGDLCCRLAWHNFDDLDLHMSEVYNNGKSYEIYYANRATTSPSGGKLDVDMNAGSGNTREPVENIFYKSRKTMKEGAYQLAVHNFCKRESDNVGFEVEIDYLGQVTSFTYAKAVPDQKIVVVAKFNYTHDKGIEIVQSLPKASASKVLWNLNTQNFHRVVLLMRSPNHWEGETGIGNKHYFFMLDGCINNGNARGLFNEFLRPELDAHRKVIEIVGSKMLVPKSGDQLSGIGFSDTRRSEIVAKVKGNFTRTLKILV